MKRGEEMAAALRDWGLAHFPEARRKSPWPGHDDLAVGDKTFAFLSAAGEPFSLSVKLRYTGEAVLERPYAKPTGYGLGRAGWVTLAPSDADLPSLDQLQEWIDESYRAVAPKRLVKSLDQREG